MLFLNFDKILADLKHSGMLDANQYELYNYNVLARAILAYHI